MAKQDKKSIWDNLGNSLYVGLNPYYTPQKLPLVPGAAGGTQNGGSTDSTTKITTATTTPKTTTTTTKAGGTSTANQYGGGSGGGTGSTKIWGNGTSVSSTNKTTNTVAGTQTVAGGTTSGGVVNQDVALYRVPEAQRLEAALAAAVKATSGASTDKGKSSTKTKTTDSKNGILSQVEASILASGPEYLRAATALGMAPDEYLSLFADSANPTGSLTQNGGVTAQARGTAKEAGGKKLSAGEVWAYGGFTGGPEDLWVMTMYGIEPEDYLAAEPKGPNEEGGKFSAAEVWRYGGFTGGMEDLWVMTMYGIEPEDYLDAAPAGAFTLAAVKPVAANPLTPVVNLPDYTDTAGWRTVAQTVADQLGQMGSEETWQYLEDTCGQVIGGNYSGKVTLLGTALQVLTGLVDFDLPGDIRDLYYDVTHWDGSKEHLLQTLLDAVGLIPVLGVVKYADEVGTLIKSGGKSVVKNEGNALSNGVEEVGTKEIAGNADAGYNGVGVITRIKYKPSSGITLEAKPEKTTTIIGSYDRDMKNIINEMGNVKSTDFGAKQGGLNVLNVPDEMYKTRTRQQFWDEINKSWLDEAIIRGDDIVLATKPEGIAILYIDDVTGEEIITGFSREYNFLLDKGYVYDELTNRMIKK